MSITDGRGDDLATILGDAARLAALARTGLPDSDAEPSFDRLSRLAAHFLGTPVALVSLVDAERQFFKSCIGLSEPWASKRETPLSHSFCQHVVASGEPLVIEDARVDPRVKGNLAIPDLGVIAYLGIPITIGDQVIGSFCAIDGQPRAWTPGEVATMSDLAQSVITEIHLRTEHRHALAAQARLQTTLASIGDGIITTDDAGLIAFLNPVAERLTGWSNAEAIGRPMAAVFRIVNDTSRETVQNPVEKVLEKGGIVGLAHCTTLIAKDGTERPIDDSAAPIRLADGRLVGCILVFRDITERREQEIRLDQAKSLLVSMLAAGNVGTWTWDLNRNERVADEKFAQIFNIPPGEPRTGPPEYFLSFIHRDDQVPVMRAVNRAIQTCGDYEIEYRLVRPGGEVRWVVARGRVRCDDRGRATQLPGIIIDITEQKRTQQQLRDVTTRLKHLLSVGSVATWTWDIAADRLVADENLARLFSLTPEEAAGGKLASYVRAIHPDDRERVSRAIAASLAHGSHYDAAYRLVQPDGSVRWVTARGDVERGETGEATALNGVVIDMTDRHRAEEDLQESERRYRTLFESMDQGFCVLQIIRDAAGEAVDYRFLEVNPAFEGQTGMPEATGKRMREFEPSHDEFWFETYGRVAATGEPARFQYTGTSLEGRSFDLYASRIGEPAEQKVAVLFTDITHRIRNEAERERLVRQLTDADRHKNEFFAILAHELRNPLGAIGNAVQLLQAARDPEMIAQIRDLMQRQIKHLTRLLDDLLDVARVSQGKLALHPQEIELADIAHRAVAIARKAIDDKRHRLNVALPDHPVHFLADPTRTEQMLNNLLTNAAKYSEPGADIDLSAALEGDAVVFRVRDTGVGIPAEMLPHIFGLFTQLDATIDRSQGGLGIGLTLVKNLAELHGGSISAASEGRGKGSTFTLRLPVGIAAGPTQAPAAAGPRAGTGRVLVVDDNPDAVQITSLLLRQAGFETEAAHDGPAAIEAARRFHPAVILLDIGLPGMNGYDVARTLRDEPCCRDALLIALSGYGDDEARSRAKAAGFDRHLVKPVDFDQLITAMNPQN